jgi:hypothetical protein
VETTCTKRKGDGLTSCTLNEQYEIQGAILFQIRYCKKKLQIVKEAASMQSVDMAIVTKLESEININEKQSMDCFNVLMF